MRGVFLLFAGCLFCFFGCKDSASTTNTGNKSQSDSSKVPAAVAKHAQSKLGDAGTGALMNVVTKYIDLKNALVNTNATDANTAATALNIAADSLQNILQNDSANKAALKPYIDTIINYSNAIHTITDATCEHQRLAFGTISSATYGLMKTAGLNKANVYQEYCPMAFNEKGAFWISAESDIKNPYFGKKMMECGEVTDSL